MTPILAQRLGTDRSFERLYRKHAGDVYRYALVVLRNEADAEDVAQTAFLNAYRAYQRGERPHKPHNWLISITHNVCRMRWRQAGSRPNEVALEEAKNAAARNELRSMLHAELDRLPEEYRTLIVHCYFEGKTNEEAARLLGCPVGTVKSRLWSARGMIRERQRVTSM